jgi:hypothetical protein
METILLIALFTLLSGYGDAHGFVHANGVWRDGAFQWTAALKSAAGFQFGAFMYWLALRHLGKLGVVVVETQTLFWFATTIMFIAVLGGTFTSWPAVDKLAAATCLASVGWLLYRTAG